MKRKILVIGLLSSILIINAQDYFPMIPGSYWLYDVYQEGVFSYRDSVVYNNSAVINDTLFHPFVHHYIENGAVSMTDTFFLYHNNTDNNTVMLSDRNMQVVDSAVFAKHHFTDGEWWVYNKIPENDTIRVGYIGNYEVTSGIYTNCFLLGDEYYFAPDAGIIKIILWNDESYYDLADYYIPEETNVISKSYESFEVFPNPARQYLELKGMNSGYFHIFDIMGNEIKSGRIAASFINVSDLKVGLYIITIENKGYKESTRFVKH
ncbi:MAG: T9SS type A sorting domain-containing protein [Bacteroidales bacterium]|nr:T9SS type A sorting domain-containing protein [Bacteroidales bacterium]